MQPGEKLARVLASLWAPTIDVILGSLTLAIHEAAFALACFRLARVEADLEAWKLKWGYGGH